MHDPFEAGIGFAVPLKTKEEDFIGKEELIKRKANPQKKLVGLELNGKEIAGHGDCVHIGRSQNYLRLQILLIICHQSLVLNS